MCFTFAINTSGDAEFTTFLDKLFLFSLIRNCIFFQDSFYLTSICSHLVMPFSARLQNPQQEPCWRTVLHFCYALSTLPLSHLPAFPVIRSSICSLLLTSRHFTFSHWIWFAAPLCFIALAVLPALSCIGSLVCVAVLTNQGPPKNIISILSPAKLSGKLSC